MKPKLVGSIVLATLIAGSLFAEDVPQKTQNPMKSFMRQKLGYSEKIVEGITLENYSMVITNGLLMSAMTQSNVWVRTGEPDYRKQTENYQSDMSAMLVAARASDTPAILKAYAKVVADCVDCHSIYRPEQHAIQVEKQLEKTQK